MIQNANTPTILRAPNHNEVVARRNLNYMEDQKLQNDLKDF